MSSTVDRTEPAESQTREAEGRHEVEGQSPDVRGGWRRMFRSVRSITRAAKRFRNDAGYVRLRAELDAYEVEFACTVASATPSDGSTPAWAEHGETLLANARQAFEEGRIEDSWRNLHAAKRVETYGLAALDGNSLETRALAVRTEALEELGSWQRKVVKELLGDDHEDLPSPLTGHEVRAASRILHDQYESVHLKRRYLQRQFNELLWLGGLAGAAFLLLTLLPEAVPLLVDTEAHPFVGWLAAFPEPPFGDGVDMSRAGFAVFVTVAGVIGASLFGMRSLRKQSLSTKIPQGINSLVVTGARGVIGALSALIMYFLVNTPFLEAEVLAANVISPEVVIVLGFAAGFSERMVPQAVEKVASLTQSDE